MNIFSLFKKKDPVGVGIDLGSTGIKIAITLPLSDGSYEIKDILYEPLEPGIVHKGVINEPQKLIERLKNLKKRIPNGTVTLAFSSHKTSVFSFKMPKDAKNVKEAVYKEIGKRIPLSISELSVEHTTTDLNGEKIVTVIMGKIEAIENVASVIEDGGIKLDAVTSAYTALANTSILCLPELYSNSCGLVVDLGHSTSTCVCITRGVITHGGCLEDGTAIIENELKVLLSIEDINQLRERIASQQIEPHILQQATITYINRILGEVDAYANLCYRENLVECQQYLLVGTGGGSCIPEVCHTLGFQLTTPTNMLTLNLNKGFKMDERIKRKLKNLGSQRFAVALGASLL